MQSELEKMLFDVDGDINGESLVTIDVDGIDSESLTDARDMVENLSKFYYDDNFMKNNPNFKKRVDSELESLRLLIKMRKADEQANDALLKAISANNNNASLYRSLTEIQKTIISITTKINEIVTGLNNMMKGYQLELNFESEEEDDEEPGEISKTSYRGSKEFISRMIQKEEAI